MPKSSTDKTSTNPADSKIAVIGIDLGKNTFHVIGLDKRGKIIFKRKFTRSALVAWFATLPPCLAGMEACVGAHHLARRLKAIGHDPRCQPLVGVEYHQPQPRDRQRIENTQAECIDEQRQQQDDVGRARFHAIAPPLACESRTYRLETLLRHRS